MLLRTDPFRNWERLFEQTAASSLAAAMDAYRLGDVITVEFDLPGVDPADIEVQIERGELRVSAQRRRSLPEGAQWIVNERGDATVSRRLLLGDTLDVEHVDAEYRDGVLTLRIPLHEAAKPRKVAVRRSDAGDAMAAITVGDEQAS